MKANLINKKKVQTILQEIERELVGIYGVHLKNIILFGSYARGDYDSESDMDIMVLLDLDNEAMVDYREDLLNEITDLSIEHDVLISVIENNISDFTDRSSYVPFYKKVAEEGVELYAS